MVSSRTRKKEVCRERGREGVALRAPDRPGAQADPHLELLVEFGVHI